MRRRQVWFLAILLIIFLAVLTGRNRTAADDRPDQSVDFRLNQIMVKLGQIEWELSQVRNRLGSQDRRLTDIDRKLDRILEEIDDVASTAATASTESTETAESSASAETAESTATVSSRAAIDPALVGTWRLAGNDASDDSLERIRRNLAGNDAVPAIPDSTALAFVNRVEHALELNRLRIIRFDSDGLYSDETDDVGIWTVYGDRLIRITKNGNISQAAYLATGSSLSLLFTGEQTLKSLKAVSHTWTSEDQELFDAAFGQSDEVRFLLIKDD